MPQKTYEVRDPASGRTFEVRGDRPPTEAELQAMFTRMGAREPDFKTETIGDTSALTSPSQSQAMDALSALWHQINPVAAVKGVVQAARHPVQTVQGIGAAQAEPLRRAQEAMRRGDRVAALSHFVNYLLPLIGPQLDEAGLALREGRYGEGIGTSLGVGMNIALPAAVARATRVNVPAAMRNPNPAEAAAADFGLRRGVPVDAGTATGNPVIRGAQWGAERTMGGSVIGQRARQAQAQGMVRVGRELADRVSPTPTSPELAGQGVRTAVTGQVRRASGIANAAYDKLRQIEESSPSVTRSLSPGAPVQSMRLPVDVRKVKVAMKPIYERLTRLYPIAKRQASAGYQAIENIVNGPDFQPLSIADDNLGAIKAVVREADMPELRTVSQGLAAEAVKQLDDAVRHTAREAGVPAISALKGGRAATRVKYRAADVLDDIRTEPVRAYRQAIESNDAAIQQLRETAAFAPKELPTIARAYLDDMLSRATGEGGFSGGARLFADWQRLGPQTKRLLFQDAALVKDLDQFFLLAKKAAENPNPSGTAFQVGLGAQGVVLVTNPILGVSVQIGAAGLAKLLSSPRVVTLLTQGLSIPVSNRVRASAVAAQLARLVGQEAVRTEQPPGRRPGPGVVPSPAPRPAR